MNPTGTPYAPCAYPNGYEFTEGSGYTLPEYPFAPPPELTGAGSPRHDIAIVGGGLAGLTLACCLARLGIAAVLLDEDNTVGVKGASSRGICYTQKSLEIYQRLGIYERIARKGVEWSVGRTYCGDDEVYAFDLQRQSGFEISNQPPFINIQQFYIEGYLVERLHELGRVDLRWRNRVTAFEQGPEGARLTVETPAGNYQLEASYVIDATGSRSLFRDWAGASVTSKKGDDRWCIADVRFTDPPPLERHTWVEAPFNDGRAVWQHLMADGVWRIDYQMAPDSDPRAVGREDAVRERLAQHFGPERAVEVIWVGPYAYRSECVDAMRHGRLFFIGDAAKVVSPFGARGGNSGIADADNLAWKLAAVLKGDARPALLDSYHAERHEAARENIRVTDRTARFMRPRDGIERLLRTAVLELARQHPFARPFVNTGRMAVANAYTRSSACGVGGGRSVQNVAVTLGDGSHGLLNDLLRADARLVLLMFGGPRDRARLRDRLAGRPVRCVDVPGTTGPVPAQDRVHQVEDQLRLACGVPAACPWALLRPDAYLAAVAQCMEDDPVPAVERALGLHEGLVA
ncbi:FAD-dependent monooxygenase [Variovorax sp. LjRoot175]|uniref:FAD-dependent oxidoreductase n=1 Tax=Variovorax sp. LjRoot175 TaxID=3342276 RepID=UPI003ECEE035